MRYSPVSMTENESLPYFGHPCVLQQIWQPQIGEETKRTHSPWLLLCIALITTKLLFAIKQYLQKLASYSGMGRLEGNSDLLQSRRIEDSQAQGASSMSEKILLKKIKLSKNCPFKFEWAFFRKFICSMN